MAVLDASFLIDLDRDLPAARAVLDHLVEHELPLLVPAHAALEYLAGYDDPDLNLQDLERSFRLVPFGRQNFVQAARLARAAFARGVFPGWADTAIAAAAVLEGDCVVTANPAHFRALGCAVWDHRNEPEPPT